MRHLIPLLLWAVAPNVFAADSVVAETAYARAVDLIDRLYLRPDELDAVRLLHSAALGLANEIDWLIVEPAGDAVYLRHGDGTPIGSVSVASMTTLPAALRSLEGLVVESGFPTDTVDVRLEILKGATTALDRYSRILAGEKLDRFDVRLKGTLVGIGAQLDTTDGKMVITSLTPHGPALASGLRVGDVITRIDGASTVNLPVREAMNLIRGEIDTPVTLTVQRAGQAIDITCMRAEVVVSNVKHQVLADNVGYVKIDYFSQRTLENLVLALDELRKRDALSKGLIVDLRQNTGGTMKEAARSADQFLVEGMLLRTVGPTGEQVQNLQSRMDAVRSGLEPEVPIVVLVDEQTASGAEILAGSLLELGRAALVGYTTYGKGTVQKVYNLDERVRLKLTVAQYILEHDRRIAEGGLVPDALVAPVLIDPQRVRFPGWDEDRAGVPWDAIVPVVSERDGAGKPKVDPGAFTVELARRAVLLAAAPTRDATVAAVRQVADQARNEQYLRLQRAFEQRGLDWTPLAGAVDTDPMRARVRIVTQTDATQADAQRVIVEVENLGTQPLHRALIEVECDSFEPWSDLVIPVGKVAPGGKQQARVTVPLPAGVDTREDVVRVKLRAQGREPLVFDDEVLRAGSTSAPRLTASVRMLEGDASLLAEVTLRNASTHPAENLKISFLPPPGYDVELLEANAALPRLDGRSEAKVLIPVRIGDDVHDAVPLTLTVDADRYRRILEWPVRVPLDGPPVALEAPRVGLRTLDLAAPIGKYHLQLHAYDERLVETVVVTANGRKVTWAGGGIPRVDVEAEVELEPGYNRISVVARDDQGLTTRKDFVLRGETTTTSVDAGDGDTD